MNKTMLLILTFISNIAFAQVPYDSNINPTKEELIEIEKTKRMVGTNYRVFVENGQIYVNEICNCYPISLGLYMSRNYKEAKIQVKKIALEKIIFSNKNFKELNVNSYNLNVNSVRIQKGIENYFKSTLYSSGTLVTQLILTISHNKPYILNSNDFKDEKKRQLIQKEINENSICENNQCYSYFFNDYALLLHDQEIYKKNAELLKIKEHVKQKYNPKDLEFLDFADNSEDQVVKIYHVYHFFKYKEDWSVEEKNQLSNIIKEMNN